MDEMEWTKVVGGVCGALLLYLVVNTGAEALYHVGGDDHGGAHASETAQPASIYQLDEEITQNAATEEVAINIEELLASADIEKGSKVFSKCKACHKLGAGENGIGPTLHNVMGRAIGTEAGYSYSNAMASFGGDWDVSNMNGFLEKPRGFMAGTKMSFAGLRRPQERADIIAYLQSLQE